MVERKEPTMNEEFGYDYEGNFRTAVVKALREIREAIEDLDGAYREGFKAGFQAVLSGKVRMRNPEAFDLPNPDERITAQGCFREAFVDGFIDGYQYAAAMVDIPGGIVP